MAGYHSGRGRLRRGGSRHGPGCCYALEPPGGPDTALDRNEWRVTDVLASPALVLVLVILHEAGKALTHSARDARWARRPLLPGLAITDLYHG